MREEAIAEIYGHLETDIVIRELENNKRYGKLTIAVSKQVMQHSIIALKDIYKTTYFPVFIWNQELLETEAANLKKGTRVLLIGELDLLMNSLELQGIETDKYLKQTNSIVINVTRNRGITIINKPVPKTDNKLIDKILPLNISNQLNQINITR